MNQSQMKPLKPSYKRESPDNIWPLRGIDGLTFAERKAKEKKERRQ